MQHPHARGAALRGAELAEDPLVVDGGEPALAAAHAPAGALR